MCVCVCVCVCARARARIYIYIYIARTELHFMLLVYTHVYQCKMMERQYVRWTLTVVRYTAVSLNWNTDSISYVETDHN